MSAKPFLTLSATLLAPHSPDHRGTGRLSPVFFQIKRGVGASAPALHLCLPLCIHEKLQEDKFPANGSDESGTKVLLG